MANHANGNAINDDSITSFKNSADNIFIIPVTEAPNTLRMPISLMRFSIVKDASPARPMQQIKIARPANMVVSLLIKFSVKNFLPNSWSTNWYSNGFEGLYFLNILSDKIEMTLKVIKQ